VRRNRVAILTFIRSHPLTLEIRILILFLPEIVQ
jgi:hypothetical protein